jgi:hypothetical protein
MYLSFILPVMEHGNVVWGGTYDSDILKLERIQVDALRLVTGATKRSSIDGLYQDTRWKTIRERIDRAMLCMMFKITNGLSPDYLTDIMQSLEKTPVTYPIRNRGEFEAPYSKESGRKSFFHKGTCLWEDLDDNFKGKTSYNSFKSRLKKDDLKRNPLFYHGTRKDQVNHARLRIGCSRLNAHLANNLHVIDDPSCMCGHSYEDSEHFLLRCNRYADLRGTMINTIGDIGEVSVDNLLHGNEDLTPAQNRLIYRAAQTFIDSTHRLDSQ